jgi:hypothetical protein
MFEMANLQEDALREYDELEQIYTETGMRSSRRVNKDYTCLGISWMVFVTLFGLC